jgi:hypothetical protein
MSLVWRWPGNARKAHVFEKGDLISLCRRWMYGGPDDQVMSFGEKPGKDDCASCWKEAKRRTEADQ